MAGSMTLLIWGGGSGPPRRVRNTGHREARMACSILHPKRMRSCMGEHVVSQLSILIKWNFLAMENTKAKVLSTYMIEVSQSPSS